MYLGLSPLSSNLCSLCKQVLAQQHTKKRLV